MTSKYMTVLDIATRYGISQSTVWRWTNSGRFPAPIKLGEKTTRWYVPDVLDYERNIQKATQSDDSVLQENAA
jgi:predicted DNA-binding transcriptional regulator AlpA